MLDVTFEESTELNHKLEEYISLSRFNFLHFFSRYVFGFITIVSASLDLLSHWIINFDWATNVKK